MTDAVMIRGWMGGLALSCTAFVSSTFTETAPTGQTLHLLTGNQREIRLGKPLERIAIGNPEIADTLLPKGRGTVTSVLIIAKKPGAANVMVWMQGGVATTHNVQVDAAAPVPGDSAVVAQGDTAVISGQPRSVYALTRARRSATAASGVGKPKDDNVIDTTSMNVSGTVQVDVRVVESSKTVLREAGFTFGRMRGGFDFRTSAPSSLSRVTFGPNGLPIESTMPIGSASNLLVSSVSEDLSADFSLLESSDMARVLTEPSLVTLSGRSVNFLAGGEIPIPVPQALGTTTIKYKPFGIGLTMPLTILSENHIALKVTPEASDLDFSRGVTPNGAMVSAIVTRRADTTVELGDDESLVIGELVSRSALSNVDKVPLLGDVPVIGTFFKCLSYNQEERELMIIITPHLVEPMTRDTPTDKMLPGQSSGWDRGTVGDPVWRPFALGVTDPAAMPGFSK